ncbi:MAG: hypothetical protein HZA16_11315 [Nitrospirae bacterium]|nr:hypothetical protein [Nitrospirota bacterium]
MNRLLALIITAVVFIFSGCASLLPSSRETTRTQSWGSFEEAKAAFEQIVPYSTTGEELQKLGFDANATSNLKILTHLDIIQRFMLNPSIKKEDLDQGIQACVDAKTDCCAYELNLRTISRKRHGNVFLDLFNFRRRTNETGWEFQALIVMVNGKVVHKLWGGTPLIDQNREARNPLGPLQESSGFLTDTTFKAFNR